MRYPGVKSVKTIKTNKVNAGVEIIDTVLGEGTLQKFKDSCDTPEEADMLLAAMFPGNITYIPELNLYDRTTGKSFGANAYTRGANTGNSFYSIITSLNEKGEPDYTFMKDYMKYLEQKKQAISA